MDRFDYLLIIALCIGLGVSIFLAIKLKRRLVKAGNKYPNIISIATGIFTFAVILFAIFYVILLNLRLER